MRGWRWIGLMVVVLLGGRLQAEDIGCVSTTFRVLGANDEFVSAPSTTRRSRGHLSSLASTYWRDERDARRGRGSIPLCSRVGRSVRSPWISTKLPKEAEVFSEKTSLVFKETRVVRLIDLAHRTLVYLAYSTRWSRDPLQ